MHETVKEKLQTKQSRPLTQIDIFSDSATQHLKQKFMLTFITSLLHTKGIKCNWHFFAMSLGKGEVDRVGGTVKQAVHSAVMALQHLVKTAEQYADYAEKITSINILYISHQHIDARRPTLDAVWDTAVTISTIQTIHCMCTLIVRFSAAK